MPRSRLLKLCFVSFCFAQLISIFGDRLNQFSVVGMIGRIEPGSSSELFRFALFGHLPILLFAPLFGTFIDRTDKTFLLFAVDGARAAVVVLVPTLFHATGSLYAFYASVFFLALADLLFSPAKSAVIAAYFAPLHLLRVNSILWTLGILGTLVGFLAGGWLFDFVSWEGSFYADAASYFISALFLLPLIVLARRGLRDADGAPEAKRQAAGWRPALAAIREGVALIRRDPRLVGCLGTQTVLLGSLGVLYVTAVSRIQSLFPPEKTMYLSAVASAATLGLLAGAGIGALARRTYSANRVVAGATFVLAAGWIAVGSVRALVPMMATTFLLGTAISPIIVITETLLQTHTPRAFRGRVFSAREVGTKTAFLAGSMIAAALDPFASQSAIMIVIGLLLAGSAVGVERKKVLKV